MTNRDCKIVAELLTAEDWVDEYLVSLVEEELYEMKQELSGRPVDRLKTLEFLMVYRGWRPFDIDCRIAEMVEEDRADRNRP